MSPSTQPAGPEITADIVGKILATVDAGLIAGLGVPTPGHMCVEAAVSYALGLEHSPSPDCVHPIIRRLVISLNDANWSGPAARAKGMRRLAVAQLGTQDLNGADFARRVAEALVRSHLSRALEDLVAVSFHANDGDRMWAAAEKCRTTPDRWAAAAAINAAGGSWLTTARMKTIVAAEEAGTALANARVGDDGGSVFAAVRSIERIAEASDAIALFDAVAVGDAVLAAFAESVVQVLVAMDAPGCGWLPLTEIS